MSRYMDTDALKKRMLDYFSPPEAFDVADLRPSWAIQDGIEDIFATFPTADVAPVVYGEWIYNKTSTLWECSNCHEEEIRSTTYCPHCGARNRGGR